MAIIIRFLFFLTLTSTALLFPYNTLRKVEFESSGSGPNEPVQGVIKVVRLDPGSMSPSEFFRRGLPHRRALSPRSRLPFPDFLSRGRPGLAPAPRAPVSPLHNLSPQSTSEMELKMKKKQGLHMWQKVLDKGDKTTLPVNLKDPKQSCAAVSFVQHVTADGCQTVRVHNKLCFGQCSSLFVPPQSEVMGPGPGTAPCSRCAPVEARTVTVPLRCGAEVREKRVMVVEECKCETSREQRGAEAATHL
ncbi:DAN domain family member 5 [Oryzias melastigma]|uniref:DAN domain family, member 5 n=1 Tax=Oryzias melastigma TaxID=30732 RepID=A0A3B3CCD0_ORYME|nr:DAN domain family member 5 [Oryzias melastigma]